MPRGRRLKPLILSHEVLAQLESFERSRSLPAGLVRRAEIVLLCAQGLDNGTVAEMMDTTRQTVGKWRQRFLEQGLMGLYDEPRPGRPRSIEEERIMELLYNTLHTKPPAENDRWSVRTAAAQTDLSKSTVQRVWSSFGVQPHKQKHFKLSTDPFFVEKVVDITGLYLNLNRPGFVGDSNS